MNDPRLRAIAITWICFAASRVLFPEPVARAEWQYLALTTLGYGHLFGAFIFSRHRGTASLTRRQTAAWASGSLLVAALALFCVYTELLRVAPWLPMALLGVSIWHGLENDRALVRAYRSDLRLEPLSASPREMGRDAAATLGVVLLAVLTTPLSERAAVLPGLAFFGLDLSEAMSFSDLFTLATGYHIVSWLLFFAERRSALVRSGDPAAARGLMLRLAAVHAPPLAVCLGLSALAGSGARDLRTFLFSPAVYLFWSALHAAQTAHARRREVAVGGSGGEVLASPL